MESNMLKCGSTLAIVPGELSVKTDGDLAVILKDLSESCESSSCIYAYCAIYVFIAALKRTTAINVNVICERRSEFVLFESEKS